MIASTNLGFPRIGPNRELKRAVEAYWAGEAADLDQAAGEVRRMNGRLQREAGLDRVPCNDFTLYDHVLDTAVLVGAVPERYRWDGGPLGLDTYFAMARGAQTAGLDVRALEMTKWFDTNYHYLVPEFTRGQTFRLGASEKPWAELAEARSLGLPARPVLLGPVSFLLLGKAQDEGVRPLFDLLGRLLPVYREVLSRLHAGGADWVQIDEPCLVQDRTQDELHALRDAYAELAHAGPKLHLQTYFGDVAHAYPVLAELPVDGLGLDFVRGRERNLAALERHGFPAGKRLGAGVVDGRNVWLCDLGRGLDLLERLSRHAPEIDVSPSCSLLHVPYDASAETGLDAELRSWLAFASEKLAEVVTLARGLASGRPAVADPLAECDRRLAARASSPRTHDAAVAKRLAALGEGDYRRRSPFAARRARQIPLPALPTTTIGSFPQTAEVRRARSRFRSGKLPAAEYEAFIEGRIRDAIDQQESIGLDVLVHGEFERNDMVEYFGEQLAGFAFTRGGWVQSYGSRCVKPPIIWGTVSRPQPMTVRWFRFAQSCSRRPVKGMLTGPVTILNWSFVRDDQPRDETCREIALAVRDEVADLEAAGARAIQIDEPALREGLPLRAEDRPAYLEWAVACFRLSASGVADATQIHTHMCYSEFQDIIAAIDALDADVISIENSRSNLELLGVFRHHRYAREIGPGVYDIHSPRVPSEEEIAAAIRRALEVIDPERLWVNPDCGLKTRGWDETLPSLRHMVAAAAQVRAGT